MAKGRVFQPDKYPGYEIPDLDLKKAQKNYDAAMKEPSKGRYTLRDPTTVRLQPNHWGAFASDPGGKFALVKDLTETYVTKKNRKKGGAL